jgi:hypothetical protein
LRSFFDRGDRALGDRRNVLAVRALLLLHVTELFAIGYRTGKKYGCSTLRTVVLCLLFGYLWWLPLRRKMQADEFTDADFVEDGQEPWREQVGA